MTYEKLLLLRWVKLSLLSELRDDTSMEELESCLGSMTDDPDKNPPSLTTPQIIFVITSFYFQVFRCIFCCLLFTVSRLTEQTKLSGKSPSLTTKREAFAGEPSFLCPRGLAWQNSCLVRPGRALVYCQFFLPNGEEEQLADRISTPNDRLHKEQDWGRPLAASSQIFVKNFDSCRRGWNSWTKVREPRWKFD